MILFTDVVVVPSVYVKFQGAFPVRAIELLAELPLQRTAAPLITDVGFCIYPIPTSTLQFSLPLYWVRGELGRLSVKANVKSVFKSIPFKEFCK